MTLQSSLSAAILLVGVRVVLYDFGQSQSFPPTMLSSACIFHLLKPCRTLFQTVGRRWKCGTCIPSDQFRAHSTKHSTFALLTTSPYFNLLRFNPIILFLSSRSHSMHCVLYFYCVAVVLLLSCGVCEHDPNTASKFKRIVMKYIPSYLYVLLT